jgi:hypothetical protein
LEKSLADWRSMMTNRTSLFLIAIVTGLAIHWQCSTAAAQYIVVRPPAGVYVRGYGVYPYGYPYGAPAVVRREYRRAYRNGVLYGYPMVVGTVHGPTDFLYRSPYGVTTSPPLINYRGTTGSSGYAGQSTYSTYGGTTIPTPSRPQARSTAKVPSSESQATLPPEPAVTAPNSASEPIPSPPAEPGPVEF